MGYKSTSTPIFRGGKHLEAIAKNKDLNRGEKAVLHTIASQMKIGGDFKEERWMFVSDIAARSGYSKRSVFRILNDLKSKQYLYVRRQRDHHGLTASLYALSAKIFYEYENILHLRDVTFVPHDKVAL